MRGEHLICAAPEQEATSLADVLNHPFQRSFVEIAHVPAPVLESVARVFVGGCGCLDDAIEAHPLDSHYFAHRYLLWLRVATEAISPAVSRVSGAVVSGRIPEI